MLEILKMVGVLTVTAMVSGLALGVVRDGTAERIAEQELKFVKEPAIREIFAGLDNDPVAERVEIPMGEDQVITVFPAKKGGETLGVALEGSSNGYGGAVLVMVGVGLDGTIAGIGVTSHKETPGLGARCVEPAFRDQFQGMTYASGVAGSVDAITGATITTGAVIGAVDQATQMFEEHRETILK